LKNDFEVSIDALDELVALLRMQPHVYGARLTGTGFGGACVALCKAGSEQEIAAQTLRRYAETGRQGRILLPERQAS
jgi:galactokinase